MSPPADENPVAVRSEWGKIPHSAFRIPHSQRGIALLIVVSLLTMIGIMGVAFAFSMYLETQASRQFVAATQARYLAEAGVNHARALLDEDRMGSRVDELGEAWTSAYVGNEADVDDDDSPEARWWSVTDGGGRILGRYAVQLTDEGGKANLNAVQVEPSASRGIKLVALLEQAGLTNATQVAETIGRFRYGDDGRPGLASIDDDGDGAIDEPDEYQPLALRGDDRRFEALEELVAVAGIDEEQLERLSRVATVYSWDLNVSVTGALRTNVNTATAEELFTVLFEAGVEDPWQAAANMADYVDPDMAMSRVTKAAQTLWMTDQGPLGAWTWRSSPATHYGSDEPGGVGLSWTVTVPTGRFRLRAIGRSGIHVGDMTVAGQSIPSVESGQSLGVFDLTGTLQLMVVNREAAGVACAFRGLELVSESAAQGVAVRGIEAVRINELMAEPSQEYAVSLATFDPQGSDWACPAGQAACVNSGVGQARWSWTDPVLAPGRYYVRVFGASAGQTVGDVRVGGTSERLVHGQSHSATLLVSSDGKISVTIGKTDPQQTYYLQSITLSLQPDAEYVELINLSDKDVDVSGWVLDGELTGGRQAKLPAGSVVSAHGLLVAAVDLEDEQVGLAQNGISAREAWAIPAPVSAVQLEFPSGSPSSDDDWLKTTLPGGSSSRLILRTQDMTVDEVEYSVPLPTTTGFQSLEKGDPSVIVDADADGVDDGWFPSLALYTPGQVNDNDGLKDVEDLKTITHDPSAEVVVLNRPLEGLGELAGLPSGTAWTPFSNVDLAKIVDRLTVEGHRLEMEGALVAGIGEDAWEEKADGYYLHTDPGKADVAGRWQWQAVPDGDYRLSLYGWSGEQVMVRWERQGGTWTDWSPILSTDAQGRVVVGQLRIGSDGTPTNQLTLEARCASTSGVCHLDHIRLDPQLVRLGAINVNTAPLEVLQALIGITDAQISRLLAFRPYGDQDQNGRGIGDLLLGDVLGTEEEEKLSAFRQWAYLLTTRSDVFRVLSLGQAMNDDSVEATQRIQAVVQR